MILSCILLRKMDIVVVSGFDAMIGLGMPCWALAKDAKTETDSMPMGTTKRAMHRNIKNPPNNVTALLDPLVINGKYRSGKELRGLVVDGSQADVRFCQSRVRKRTASCTSALPRKDPHVL